MKAKINGIEVEGTPQEIHELMVAMGPVKFKPLETQPTTEVASEIKKNLDEYMNQELPHDHPFMRLFRGEHSGLVFKKINL